jgi:tricorn protease
MRIRIVALATLLAVRLASPALAEKTGDDPTVKDKPPLLLQKPTVSKSHIVFSYADDLWIVPREGGEAKRLTTGPGVETDPHFSPDGNYVAFTGQYQGNEDVYVIPAAGGTPKRLTYHPGPDQVAGWTPDGKRILFRSGRNSYSRFTRLFTVPAEGGFPEEVPVPLADSGSYSADGKRLAFVPHVNHPRSPGANVAWKRYRGGRQPYVAIAELADSSVAKLPRKRSNDFNPMWVGERIYFLSDRNGPVTLFAYDLAEKNVKQLIDNNGMDIKAASAGPDAIVFEKPGGLYLYHLDTGKTTKVEVTVKADLAGLRPRFVKVNNSIQNAALSPAGVRAVFEARGEIFTVPAKKGHPRNLTGTPGVAERSPAWSPDGKHIAYFSDESGEYELHVRPQTGHGKVRKFKPGEAPSFYYNPVWSPDSKRIAYTDKRDNFWYLDLDGGNSTKIDTNPFASRVPASVWSPDGKWLAYVKQLNSHMWAVFLHSLESGKSHQLSDGMSDAGNVAFDKGGKHLYFTASTDSGLSSVPGMSAINRPVSSSVYVVVLSAKDPSPLAPESDEEGDEEAEKADKPKADKPKEGGADKKALPTVRIDLEDIDQRILALPIPARNYADLLPGKAGTIFLVAQPPVAIPSRMNQPPTNTLYKFELSKRKPEKVLEGVNSVRISHNGEKLLYRQGGKWFINPAGQPAKPGEGALATETMEVRVDPAAEWRQMYREVWRIERDFLYDPGYHGLDINAAKARYEPFLAGVASRHDLSYLFEEMLGELSLGHVYIFGGDRDVAKGPGGGLLGADVAIENSRYRFTRIYHGENWNPELRAPLTQPGARVKSGEYLLAIDGKEVKAGDSPYRHLEGKAEKTVLLKVGPKPDGTGSREISVVPVASEQMLRHFAWVTDNRRKVDKMTGGKVAYIYLPNTSLAGHDRFVREFYAQTGKQAAIIDERYNGGGFLADQVVDLLGQSLRSFVATREGEDFVVPRAIFGPKVMLINEAAGSGGDYLPYTFRDAKVGKLIGKRTWGGLVGIGGYPPLIDGGMVTAPHFALWFPTEKWEVENNGVEPDIEVEFDPKAVRQGRDPQLEKAVEVVLEELKRSPPKKYKRPAYPNYHKKGEESARK